MNNYISTTTTTMVRTDTKTETVKNLYQRNTDKDWKDSGNGIQVKSDFQRGDEETGVWSLDFRQSFVDSIQRGYPSGILTFVKDYKCATAYQNPWSVLDGGNRMRAIRDYIEDKFVDLNNKKYSQLTEQERAEFNTILIPCQEITIERNDPDNTISDMFIRLNTKTNPLRSGELFKAHGHRGDVWQIEMAKDLVGDCWTSSYDDNVKVNQVIDIAAIRESWSETFGKLGETSRCDNLAMIIGYIVSASTGNFTLFDKRYSNLYSHLSSDTTPTHDELIAIYGKLWLFLDTISHINDLSIFGRIVKGAPPQTKIAPVWKKICEGTFTTSDRTKMITFYNSISDNIVHKKQYFDLFKGSNSETGSARIQKIIDFILSYD